MAFQISNSNCVHLNILGCQKKEIKLNVDKYRNLLIVVFCQYEWRHDSRFNGRELWGSPPVLDLSVSLLLFWWDEWWTISKATIYITIELCLKFGIWLASINVTIHGVLAPIWILYDVFCLQHKMNWTSKCASYMICCSYSFFGVDILFWICKLYKNSFVNCIKW